MPIRSALTLSVVLATLSTPAAAAAIELAGLAADEAPVSHTLTDDEARRLLDRELSLKVGKQMRQGDYPDEARRWRWSGTAMIEVVLSADGLVQEVLLARSSGYQVLDEQALAVVRRVPKVYLPVQLRGRAQRAVVPIDFHFREP